MQSKSEGTNVIEPDPHAYPPNTLYSEPWWRNFGYNGINPAMTGVSVSHTASLDSANGNTEPNEEKSLNEEEDDATEKQQNTASPGSGGQQGQELNNAQFVGSTMVSAAQPPQLELVGHSIACASNMYQDPYYGGIMAAYGHQPLGYPPYVGMPQARMPLHLEMAQEPVYVNAKQYQGILRRRQARAKAELERKLVKNRKPYLHESRHQHALRRARGTGGRFSKKTDASMNKNTNGKEMDQSAAHSQSVSSSGSEPVQSDSAETWNSNNQNGRGNQVHDSSEGNNHSRDKSQYRSHGGAEASSYNAQSSERDNDRDCLTQQHDNISSELASQTPLAIQ